MNDLNRTPPTPDDPLVRSPATIQQATRESAVLNEDGLDLRRFSQLSPLEQLEKLEADGRALNAYEKARRKADEEWRAAQQPKKDVAP